MKPERIFCFGAAPFKIESTSLMINPKTDFIIALDGGLNWLLPHHIIPHLFIGDCDSLSPDLHDWLSRSSIQKILYPTEKDESDYELASQFIISHFSSSIPIVLYRMSGGRTDHFLINLSISKQLSMEGFHVELIGDHEKIIISNGSKPIEILNHSIANVSLYPLSDVVEGITTHNLKYPLVEESLLQNSSRGLSNVPIGEKMIIIHKRGILAILLIYGGKNENLC
jgi:thiamine pyrophosphokinase